MTTLIKVRHNLSELHNIICDNGDTCQVVGEVTLFMAISAVMWLSIAQLA
jgi:hypothetical protein